MLADFGFLTVAGFATFRLWRLIAVDALTAPLRAQLPDRVAGWITCPWCSGFWLAVLTFFVLDEWGTNFWVAAITVIFAISGLVGLLADATRSDES